MDYYFEAVQNLKLAVYDIDNATSDLKDDDFLGGVELTLGQVHARPGLSQKCAPELLVLIMCKLKTP